MVVYKMLVLNCQKMLEINCHFLLESTCRLQSVEKIKQKVFTNFENMINYKQKERRWYYVWKEFEILQIEK